MAAAKAPSEVLPASFADRVAGALWGLHIGDAIAMPAHWYYGGERQVEADYGRITGYVKPKVELRGSIMALSNTGGAGRGGNDGDIIGSVIAHGKKPYWARGRAHHYHCTLEKGENTVDADCVRLCYKSVSDNGGQFSPDKLRENYVSFMTTPGAYNDCYISTTHRMFFANRERGLPLDKCPDNDNHNVDTTCGLPMTVPVALASASLSAQDAHKQVADCVAVTRRSPACQQYGNLLADMLRSILADKPLGQVMESTGGSQLTSALNRPDPVVA
jgi:ADP-ribosylglycohydrolase